MHWESWVPFIHPVIILVGIILAIRMPGKWRRFFIRAFVGGSLFFAAGIICLILVPELFYGLFNIALGAILFISGLFIRNTKWDYKL